MTQTPRASPRIFQIGFNKCGTRTINYFLKANGIAGVHWQGGKLARNMFRNLTEGWPLLAGYDDYVAFSDMEYLSDKVFLEAYKLFPILHQQYPDAVFILNTRDRDRWVKSRLTHGGGRYAAMFKEAFGLASDEALTEAWKEDWARHHARALDYFRSSGGRLVRFDIEQDDPALLVEAMPEFELDLAKYVHRGKTAGS
jgi:hypothetical protein